MVTSPQTIGIDAIVEVGHRRIDFSIRCIFHGSVHRGFLVCKRIGSVHQLSHQAAQRIFRFRKNRINSVLCFFRIQIAVLDFLNLFLHTLFAVNVPQMVFQGSALLEILDVINPVQRTVDVGVQALVQRVVGLVTHSLLVKGLPASLGLEVLRDTGNACGNLGVHRLPVQRFLQPVLLGIGEVGEIALSVAFLLHSALGGSSGILLFSIRFAFQFSDFLGKFHIQIIDAVHIVFVGLADKLS